MRLLNRFVSITALLIFSYSLVLVSHSGLLAHAQEPSPFEIRIVPQAEYAVSGQPFTYTIMVTNTSQTSVKDIFVTVKIPSGATYANAHYTNPKWFGGNPNPATQVDEIIWFTPELLTPSEVVTFELIVNVLPEPEEERLTIDEYAVSRAENDTQDILASGPPVTTRVLVPTPTMTPAPSPTLTATNTPELISVSTSTPTSLSDPDVGQITPTVSSIPASQSPEPVLPLATTTAQTTVPTPLSPVITFSILMGLALFTVIVIGIVWILRHR